MMKVLGHLALGFLTGGVWWVILFIKHVTK